MVVRAEIPLGRGRQERASGHWRDRFVDGYLSAAAAQFPDRIAVCDGYATLTYREADALVNAVANSLAALGVRAREAVSWQLPNWHEAYLLHHAVLRLGAVSNPIVPIYRQHEVEYIVAQARSRVLVVPKSFRGFDHMAMVDEIRAALPDLRQVVVARPTGGDVLDFADLLAGERTPPPVERSPDDPILLMFTSGTTARPKGVVHTHNTLEYEDRSIIDSYRLTGSDVVWMPSPVTHVTGMLYGLHLPPMLATTSVLQDIWDADVALSLLSEHRCTFTVAATPFLHGLAYHPELGRHDLGALRVFACGGADVPSGLIRDARVRLDCFVTRVYGSTEFPTLSTTGPGESADKAADTDGHAIGAAAYRIVDDDDNDVATGSIGELLVTGPERLIGYLRPEDDAGAFTEDGWFRTGDLASVDAEGYISIRGRKKDIVLRGGENISVTEVEDLLFEHPMVEEIAIVAMPDPVMVERACAFVVPVPGAEPTLAELCTYLAARRVAKQKYPERLELIGELPKTQSGKVQKFRLREEIRARMAEDLPAGGIRTS